MRVFETIRSICDEALMNKSFGMPGRVTDGYVEDLNKLIRYFQFGGQTGSIDDVGYGARNPFARD